ALVEDGAGTEGGVPCAGPRDHFRGQVEAVDTEAGAEEGLRDDAGTTPRVGDARARRQGGERDETFEGALVRLHRCSLELRGLSVEGPRELAIPIVMRLGAEGPGRRI